MTQQTKIIALEKMIVHQCSYATCDECEFFKVDDDLDGKYFCGIRDNNGKIPYYKEWNMKEALGLHEYKPSPFPEDVTNSMMQHFTKVE